jgi:hypothetical protein
MGTETIRIVTKTNATEGRPYECMFLVFRTNHNLIIFYNVDELKYFSNLLEEIKSNKITDLEVVASMCSSFHYSENSILTYNEGDFIQSRTLVEALATNSSIDSLTLRGVIKSDGGFAFFLLLFFFSFPFPVD